MAYRKHIAYFVFCSALVIGGKLLAQSTNKEAQIAAIESEMKAASSQVEKIVNQPVAAYRRTPGMHVSVFQPGWFHEGASKPNFTGVDVRTTQESIYDKYEYVTSDLNPGIVFIGRQLEFNSNLKYFYTNRSIPKKKLTEAEMLEINRLYRIIGRCEHDLAALKNPEATGKRGEWDESNADAEAATSTTASTKGSRPLNIFFGVVLVLLIGLILYSSFRRKRK